MDISNLAEYGAVIVTLGVLAYVVKVFIGIIKKFIEVIENHLSHSTETQGKLTEAIHSMLQFLERNNK